MNPLGRKEKPESRSRLACKAEAERILLDNKDVVMALAAELRAKRTLNGQQIDDVIQRVADQRAHSDALARRAAWRQIKASAENASIDNR